MPLSHGVSDDIATSSGKFPQGASSALVHDARWMGLASNSMFRTTYMKDTGHKSDLKRDGTEEIEKLVWLSTSLAILDGFLRSNLQYLQTC